MLIPIVTVTINKLNLFTIGAVAVLFSLGACTTTDEVESSDEDSTVDRTGARLPVNLGTAGDFAILSKSGISTVPPATIKGDIGVSPIAATAITGFALTSHSTYATSIQVTGRVYAANYAAPTPVKMTTAIGDMQTAYTNAAGRAADVTELGAGNIGGMTINPGVYKWGTGLLIPTSIYLKGSSTDLFIFQIGKGLTMSSNTNVYLIGGVLPKNVVWQVSEGVTLNSRAHLEGIVLAKTAITLGSAASVKGRLLSQTAVTLINNTVVQP